MPLGFVDVMELMVEPRRARVHEAGWQSWSPEGTYRVDTTSPRPRRAVWQTMAFRPGRPGPASGFQGEGLLAIDPGDGSPVRLVQGAALPADVPSIRAELVGSGRLRVSADGPVRVVEVAGSLAASLAAWATDTALGAEVSAPARIPPVWCSWYCYWRDVTSEHLLTNEADAHRLGIDVDVIQIDDGWQAAIGDWDLTDPRFGDLGRTVGELRSRGRSVGIWLAPFLAVPDSRLALEHPDWLLPDTDAGFNWGAPLRVVDLTHPGAREHLHDCLRRLALLGVSYFKLDFLYAGAMEGRRHRDVATIDAYRDGLRLLRDGAGPGATVVGCGAPLLPSLGLVDAMRVSPDIMPTWEPPDGDVSQPGGRSAVLAGSARTHLDGRFWVNDPDCLLARPGVERREVWADHLRSVGGLASSSDPLASLDEWGLSVTRELLQRRAADG
ncbi:alpha-galactosidase [Acidimicrobiaceae bacterium USS-CC1]|uniref:Alpha-galactosidase n=1 Tax=Acidiferrimicrobium australe TaxID=2664430 RepID=A0ABW9QRT2_9ACTN|nr:alpha-galactosidase [Acidiferrimicrobium australe]